MPTNNSINSSIITRNTVMGDGAIVDNTSSDNTIIGANTIADNGSSTNTYIGSGIGSVTETISSQGNVAVGSSNFIAITDGAFNVAIGGSALQDVTTGINNTAVGLSALSVIDTGSNNIAVGFTAGSSVNGSSSNNIYIGDTGSPTGTESNALRIASSAGGGLLTTAYIGGIDGVDLSTAEVITMASDQLGSATLTAGAGINITPGAGVITIEAPGGGSGISVIDGNSGSATGATVTITTNAADTTARFTGSGSTVTLDFADSANNAGIGGGGVLDNLTSGTFNTAFGWIADGSVTSGVANMGFGYGANSSVNTGSYNCAFGMQALTVLTSGNRNTVLGGNQSGISYTSSESDNIIIGQNSGIVGESNVLRIAASTGTGTGQLNAAYIGGIDGIDLSTAEVVTMASDQLGSATLTAGAGINITPGAGVITIEATGGGSGISVIDGNSGSATGATVTITTNAADTTARFTGSGSTVTLDFGDQPTGSVAIGGGGVLSHLTTGILNTAFGWIADSSVTSGNGNVGFGYGANSFVNTGSYNCAFGSQSLTVLTSGSGNTVLGGSQSGISYTSSESDNIIIGQNSGVVGESNVLRIAASTGTGTGQLNAAYIAGIQGITVTGTPVLISSSDQLGIAVSSERFKTDIQDMANDSSFIYDLRPVTFLWKKDSAEGLSNATDERQFGLIAEEVAKVMPSLATYDKTDHPLTVKYADLPAILLNEIQKLRSRIEVLEKKE